MTLKLKLEKLQSTPAFSKPAGTNAKPQLVYLVRREGLSSVFASQVATRMAAVAEAGIPVDVGVFTPVGQWLRPRLRRRWRAMIESLPDSLAGHVRALPSFPSRIDWPRVEAAILSRWLRSRYRRSDGLIVQCRNATVTRMALGARRKLPGLRVIFDCRGVQDHELLYIHGATYDSAPPDLKARAEQLREEEQLAAQQADAIVCVSGAMVDYLAREHGIGPEKCMVMPCCVDTRHSEAAVGRREEVRRRLGLEGRLVVAYCGSLVHYQLPEETLRLFLRISKAIMPQAHFLAVTTQPDAMRTTAAQVGVPAERMTVVSVPHDEVAAHLAAADVGLLLRERCAVNQVASPVKFAEYLASGTPVIMSEGIGDYSSLAETENVGLVLPTDASSDSVDGLVREFLADYQSDPTGWQSRCRRVAREQLGSLVHLPKVIDLFRRLNR